MQLPLVPEEEGEQIVVVEASSSSAHPDDNGHAHAVELDLAAALEEDGCGGGSGGSRDELYEIGLPGKSILGHYFQENRTSRRPFLLLRIRGSIHMAKTPLENPPETQF